MFRFVQNSNENIFVKTIFLHNFKVYAAVQQTGFVRVKRGLRSSIPSLNNPTLYADDMQSNLNVPTDPYFPLQWYLRNTGQNGGKIHLDLNVQAAWDQGITGKNITTAIMDDGKRLFCKNILGYFKKKNRIEIRQVDSCSMDQETPNGLLVREIW